MMRQFWQRYGKPPAGYFLGFGLVYSAEVILFSKGTHTALIKGPGVFFIAIGLSIVLIRLQVDRKTSS